MSQHRLLTLELEACWMCPFLHQDSEHECYICVHDDAPRMSDEEEEAGGVHPAQVELYGKHEGEIPEFCPLPKIEPPTTGAPDA